MSVTVTVKAGCVVRDQQGRKCPDGQFRVDETDFFWRALIRCGDLVPASTKSSAASATAAAADTAKKAS